MGRDLLRGNNFSKKFAQDISMKNNYCFSILALKPKYQLLAKNFAKDLTKYAPGITVVIGTDDPTVFEDCSNVIAFKFQKKGVLHCYHDKRFVIERALAQFNVVIQIDADTRVIGNLPDSIDHFTGLAAIHIENLVNHSQKHNPERLGYLYTLADKLEVNLDTVSYIGESLFALSVDEDRSSEFIRQWDLIARYLELREDHAGEGNAIGLAAAKAKIDVIKTSWLENINRLRQHFDASQLESKKTTWDLLNRKLDYHYRLNKARMIALKDFVFFYR